MAEPRKVFRIEETAATSLQPQGEDDRAAGSRRNHARARRVALAARHRTACTPSTNRPIAARRYRAAGFRLHLIHSVIRGTSSEPLDPGLRLRRTDDAYRLRTRRRIGSEQATQKEPAAAEDIDQAANNLSAALKGEIEQGLAQDIQDRVIEACNYQDLTSQRVKVMATLDRVEGQITRALAELTRADDPLSMHGPRLDSDRGASDSMMFGAGAQ